MRLGQNIQTEVFTFKAGRGEIHSQSFNWSQPEWPLDFSMKLRAFEALRTKPFALPA